jgi:hypothetical protein
MWSGVKHLVEQIRICQKAGATTSAIAMSFVCIDTISYLALPSGREKQGRRDFITWVDSYLVGHPDQPYQYRGTDVYGARCAVLHAFSSEVDYHQLNPDAMTFGYHDGGMHAYDPVVNERLVMIGTASFLNDVIKAIESFMQTCLENAELRSRVESRLPTVLINFPAPKLQKKSNFLCSFISYFSNR